MFEMSTEPQPIAKVLDAGFKLCFTSFKKAILLSLILNVVMLLPNFIYGIGTQVQDFGPPELTQYIFLVIGLVLFYLIFSIAILYRIYTTTTDTPATIQVSLQLGVKIFFWVLLATLLYALMVSLGFLLLVIPGIALGFYFSFFMVIMVIEGLGPIAALERSVQIVKGNWWRVFLVFMVIGIIYMIFYTVIGIVFGIAVGLTSPEQVEEYLIYLELSGAVIGTLLLPFTNAMSIAMYNDLRLRRDGSDLEARIAEMS